MKTCVYNSMDIPVDARRLIATPVALYSHQNTSWKCEASIMTHQELDLALLVCHMATIHMIVTRLACSRHKPAERQMVSSNFIQNGYSVCMNTFGLWYWPEIGKSYCEALQEQLNVAPGTIQRGSQNVLHHMTTSEPKITVQSCPEKSA